MKTETVSICPLVMGWANNTEGPQLHKQGIRKVIQQPHAESVSSVRGGPISGPGAGPGPDFAQRGVLMTT